MHSEENFGHIMRTYGTVVRVSVHNATRVEVRIEGSERGKGVCGR